jgi:hypothetical protein
MTKILIATPAYGEMFYTPYVSSLVGLQRLMARQKWEMSFISVSYADIVESRNFLLTHWYDKTDATHLLFIDADMGYEAQLVADMVQLDQPVAGVIYPRRQINLERLVERAAEGQPFERARAQAHDFIVRRGAKTGQAMRNGFVTVDGCGTGLFLIRRDCIAQMLRKMPELTDVSAPKQLPIAKTLDRLIRAFDPLIADGTRLSEDFSFCHRWRQCGGEIWANTTHEVTHVGLHRFAARYAARGARISIGNLKGPAPQSTAPAAKQGSREHQSRPRGTRASPQADDGEPPPRNRWRWHSCGHNFIRRAGTKTNIALMGRLGL